MPSPLSTYRVQLSADQPFSWAAALVPHLVDLGATHLSLTPVLTARPGTRHFSDVADHRTVDAALGGEDGLRALADTAHDAGLGLIGDVVPNHMGTGPWSPWWERLLAEGRSSEVAKTFDVDWEPPLPGARDKVILPVLDSAYGDALAEGHIGLVETDSGVRVVHGDLSFPVNAESARALERTGLEGIEGVPGEERTWQRMHSLLEQQHYRLVSAAAGARLVNYRRYGSSDHLAALRVEDDAVFQATHATMARLVADGVLDGLRVDHLDGLADPARYLQRLRDAVGEDTWIVVDVVAEPGEGLPDGWPVQGTVGLELLRTTLGLHVDPAGLKQLRDLAAAHGALPSPVDRWRMKEAVLDSELGPDLRRAARVMWSACQDDTRVRDVDYRTLLEAVTRLATSLARSRTYVDPQTGEAAAADVEAIRRAVDVARAQEGRGSVPDRLWSHLQGVLTGEVRWTAAVGEAVTRFQQLTAPLRALGVEGRLFLRHHALVAGCEVGCEPDDLPRTLARAHAEITALPAAGMRATSGHDTLHGEDVRLRMAALTGMAGEWTDLVEELLAVAPPPSAALGLRLLQVAVGAWPAADDGTADLADLLTEDLRRRFADHAIAAARGQAVLTTHRVPVPEAEAAVRAWAAQVLQPGGPIAPALRDVAVRAGEIGMAASLSQSLVRLTVPGVADTSQGDEVWRDTITDLDAHRGADVDRLRTHAPDLRPEAAGALWASRRDGRIKHHVVRAALHLRRDLPEALGPGGTYLPLTARGRWAEHIHAFALRDAPAGRGGRPSVVVLAPRALGRVTDGGRFEPRGRIWADTDLALPEGPPWTDVLTGHTVGGGDAPVATLLATLPVALLRAQT